MSENKKESERGDGTRKSKGVGDKTRKSKKQKKKIQPTHVVIVTLGAALIGVLAFFLWPSAEELPAPPTERPIVGGRGTLLTPENIAEVREQFSGPLEDAQYTVSMTSNWEFETALSPSSNARVNNVERNTRTVYFDVTLRGTDELVYSSPYILLGGTVSNFALDKELEAGVHDAIVTFFLVDDDFEVVADVQVTVTLTING